MNDQVALPWYKSRIIVGIATIIATRLLDYAQKQWNFDASVFGFTVNDLVSFILDSIAAVSAYVALHARVAPSVPIPPVVTLTKSAADQLNSPTGVPNAPPESPAVPPTRPAG